MILSTVWTYIIPKNGIFCFRSSVAAQRANRYSNLPFRASFFPFTPLHSSVSSVRRSSSYAMGAELSFGSRTRQSQCLSPSTQYTSLAFKLQIIATTISKINKCLAHDQELYALTASWNSYLSLLTC